MAIATSAAIALVAAGASAGGSIAAAKMGSNAAKNAAKTQAQSAREAQGLAGNIFQQQQQMQSPYMGLGQGAAMTLGRLMGQPQGARFAAPPMNLGQFGGGGQFGALPPPPSGIPSGVARLGPPTAWGQPPQMGPQGPPNPRDPRQQMQFAQMGGY